MGWIRMAAAAGLAGLALSAAAGAAPQPAPKPAAPAEPIASVETHTLDRADLEAWLDGRIPYALKSGDIAGAVVVVVKDGAVLFEKGYGWADVAAKTPMDPERTLIRPGSTSKLFTWTAVMQLVQAGKLDLDRDINDYLDFKVAHRGRPITLRDLMDHRGGFEEGLKGILTTDPHGLQSTEQYLKTHLRPVLFETGEVPAYSNYGASLAGYIVQRVSGEPFELYVERHIFQPLGMTNSTFEQPLLNRVGTGTLARGYRTGSGEPFPYELIVTRPAGSVTTTAADMSRFMLAHLGQGGPILAPATEALMQSPTVPPFKPGFATMAHGFFDQVQNGQKVVGHGGDTVVFHTELDLLPQQGVGIFYSFNSRGAEDAVYVARQQLFNGFMDRYFPAPKAPEPAALPTAAKDAQEIAGLYESSRRVEHGFLSFFYLLQQTPITPNPDGTINGPGSIGRGEAKFREVGPGLWREIGGTRELALTTVRGVKTVVDSEDPITVLQAAPFLRSAPLNVNVLLGSVAVLFWTVALWALSPWLRRGDRAQAGVSPEARRLRLFLRSAAALDVAWLLGWFVVLQPVLSTQLQAYGPGVDPLVLTLELSGFLVIAAAAVGGWAAWRTFRSDATWLSRIWAAATALGLLGLVWIGLMGRLIGVNLNY